jgi:hypothetical protein
MKKNKNFKNLDLDLIELIQLTWNGKWVISAIMALLLIVSVGYYKKKNDAKLNYFTSEIEFLKIYNLQAEKYSIYNSLISFKSVESKIRPQEFFIINPQYLFVLYLEIIQDKEVFERAIKNSKMINKKNYPSEEKFNAAINKKVSSIKIYPPDIIKKKYFKNDKIHPNWRINFYHNNEAEWTSIFEEANKLANEKVIEIIKTRFNNSLNHEKFKVSLKIKALDLEIKDLKDRYRKEQEVKLRFLREQAELSRELNFEDHNIKIEDAFQSYQTRVNSKFSAPMDLYYLKGYKAIEKEIEFISESLRIGYYGDNETTLLGLQTIKNNLINDNSLNEIKREFNSTPIKIRQKDFAAATIRFEPAQYEKHGLLSAKLLAFVILMSFAIGLVFLLVIRQVRSTSKD